MALSTKTTLALSILVFLFILVIHAYLIIYSYEYNVQNYRIFLGLSFIVFIIALVMMTFTLINLINVKPKKDTPIFLNTCPDYYYREKVKDDKASTDTITIYNHYCKPFIFEGSKKEFLYVLKELQPFAKNHENIENDQNYYNNGLNSNAFYDINLINIGSASSPNNKVVKVLNFNNDNFKKKIDLNDLNKLADKSSNKEIFNTGLCSCALNLGWNELQKECGEKNLYREDNVKACDVISKQVQETTGINTDLDNLTGLNYQNYYNNILDADKTKVNNQHFIDLKTIQVNLTS